VYVCSQLCLLFVAPWNIAHQVTLSMEFFSQGYWSGLAFPSPWCLPHLRTKPASLVLAGGFFTTSTTWEAQVSDQRKYRFEEVRYCLRDHVKLPGRQLFLQIWCLGETSDTEEI